MTPQNHPLDLLKTPNTYPKGIVVSGADMEAIHIVRDEFHGEWNYTTNPYHVSD